MYVNKDSNFSITIDYKKESERPSRIFESMASIIKSFEQFDKDMVRHLDSKIETVLLLEDIEKGSLRTILSNILKKIPDNALEDFDLKKAIGHYLLKAKYIMINKLEGKAMITDGQEIEDIEYELVEAAKETGVDKLTSFVPASKKAIIKHIDSINKATDSLDKEDKVSYEYDGQKATFNLMMKMDYDGMEDLITKESFESNSKMVLKVRKPDYLGESKWSFKHGTKPLDAKILDTEWLFKFKNREIDVRPQDALVCDVKIVAKYDHDNNLISTTYEIKKVISVRNSSSNQETLF